MALISMYERDNSRTVYRILADQAVKYFDNPSTRDDEKIPLVNLARLLERYRYDAFSDYAPLGVLEVLNPKNDSVSTESRAPTNQIEDVVRALEASHARVYGQISKDDLVQTLQGLLAKLAASSTLNEPDTKRELEKARKFFVAFAEGLALP